MIRKADQIITDVEESFNAINKKIISLNECSSDDFISLSNSFKNSYSQINLLTKNATLIFDFLGNAKKDFYEGLLDDAFGEKAIFFKKINSLLKDIHDENHKDLYNKNVLYLSINNLKQNISTFKFLLTNYKLKENSAGKKADSETLELLNIEIVNIHDISRKFLNCLKKCDKSIIDIIKDHNIDFVLSYNYIVDMKERALKMLNEKYEQIITNSTVLDQKSTIYTESFSKIITNLQYQDIIRQKIEHIYEAHNGALADISEINKKDHKNEAASNLGQIKEIAEIQAAQLIHTNKEYQNSINIILDKFKELATTVEDIADLGNLFYGKTSGESSFLNDIRWIVEVTSTCIVEISNIKTLIHKVVLVFKNEIEQLSNFKTHVNNYKLKADGFITSVFANVENKNINEIIVDIDKEVLVLNTLIDSYTKEIVDLMERIGKNGDIHNIEENLDYFIKSYNNLLKNLKEEDNSLIYKINENKKLGIEIIEGIQVAIDSVKFYNYFDTTVEEIIDELDRVRSLLNSEGFSGELGERVMKLRDIYTMQTERDVHDSILKGMKSDEHTNINDDNLELF